MRRASTPSTRRPARCSPTSRTGWPRPASEATTAERERSALAARKEALELGLNRKDGAGALLAATDSVSGLLGSVAALLSVQSGYEAAVAAALGGAADAVAVRDVDAAIGAIDHLKTDDLGRAGILLGGAGVDDAAWPGLPEGAVYAIDVVECPDDLRPALSRLLFKVAVVDDLAAAQDAGRRAARRHGGHPRRRPARRALRLRRLLDRAQPDRGAGGGRRGHRAAGPRPPTPSSGSRSRRRPWSSERLDAANRVDVALARLHESDATLAAVAEELGQYGSVARSARGEAERLATQIAAAEAAREQAGAGLAELEQRLSAAEAAPEEEPDTSARERLADAARAARQAEMDARLALRTAEERARALHGRADSLRRTARAEREARARAIARRERVLREGRAGRGVVAAAAVVLARLEESVTAATVERTRGRGRSRRAASRS